MLGLTEGNERFSLSELSATSFSFEASVKMLDVYMFHRGILKLHPEFPNPNSCPFHSHQRTFPPFPTRHLTTCSPVTLSPSLLQILHTFLSCHFILAALLPSCRVLLCLRVCYLKATWNVEVFISAKSVISRCMFESMWASC